MQITNAQAAEIRAVARAAGIPSTGERAIATGMPPDAFREVAKKTAAQANGAEIKAHHSPGSAPISAGPLDPASIYAARREAATKGNSDG